MAKLSWNVQNAVSVTISPGIGAVAPSGEITVNPSVPTVYTITATDARGRQTSSSLTIGAVVVGSPAPVGSPGPVVGGPAPVGAPVGGPVVGGPIVGGPVVGGPGPIVGGPVVGGPGPIVGGPVGGPIG